MRTLSNRMIGLLLAATAVTPIAAQAQMPGQNDHGEHERGRGGGEGRGGEGRGDQGQRPQQAPVPQAQAQQRPQAAASAAQPDRRAEQRDGPHGQVGQYNRRDAAIAANQAEHRDDRRDDHRDDRRNWQDDRGRGDIRRDDHRDANQGRPDDRRGWNEGRRDDRGNWNRDWRGDRRYGWQDYRSSNRSAFRVPRYIAPRGYGYNYRRWSPGLRIDPWFYGPSYWINDPWDYRLPPAYGDYRWVRYYDDVYLIDIRTGYIEDVIYSFFWR